MAVTYSLFQLLNLLISKNFKSYATLPFKEAQAETDELQWTTNDFPLDVVQCCSVLFTVSDSTSHRHATAVLSTDFEHG